MTSMFVVLLLSFQCWIMVLCLQR